MSRESPPPAVGTQIREFEGHSEAHDHFGLLYNSRENQLEVALSFLERGLDRGDRIVYAVADNTKAEMREAMTAAGIPVDELCDSGQLTLRTTRDLYLSESEFDGEEMLTTIDEFVAEVTEDGDYSGLRITTEFTGEILDRLGIEEFMQFESEVNRYIPDHDLFGLCQYDRDSIPPEVAEEVIRTHPMLGSRRTVGPNSYYQPPSSYRTSLEVNVDSKLAAHRSQVATERELRRRERGVTSLIGATQDVLRADWSDAAAVAVQTVRETAGYDAVALWSYDSETDAFDVRTAACADALGGSESLSALSELAWQAFVTTEEQHRSLDADEALADTTGLQRVAAFPVPGEGALLVGTRETERLDGLSMRIGRAFSRTLRVALERGAQERRLEESHEDVSRLEAINGLARETIQATTEATTREEIERAFCEAITAAEEFAFAWVGEVEPNDRAVTARSWAGDEQGYLTDVVDDPRSDGPVVEAAQSGEVTIASAIADQHHTETWREEALERGFRSVANIPLVYEGISYGVVAIYATYSDAFDELLEDVLTELGHFVGYMLNTIEQQGATSADGSRELEVELSGSRFPLLELARRADCTLEVDEILAKAESQILAIGEARDVDVDVLAEAAEAAVSIDGVDAIDLREDTVLLDLSLSERFVGATLGTHGADLQSVRADPESACLVIGAPDAVDDRSVVDVVADRYREPSLVAKRQPSNASERVLTTDLRDQLTDRQREVARVAYCAGYFEQPRSCTGTDVAEALDISPQAFYQHVRRIQRLLFEELVGE